MIARETTSCSLLSLQEVCNEIHEWNTRWRMIINCEPGKTELICFGTAEKDDSILPSTSLIGDNHIKFVEKTKVLGLIMDKKPCIYRSW